MEKKLTKATHLQTPPNLHQYKVKDHFIIANHLFVLEKFHTNSNVFDKTVLDLEISVVWIYREREFEPGFHSRCGWMSCG